MIYYPSKEIFWSIKGDSHVYSSREYVTVGQVVPNNPRVDDGGDKHDVWELNEESLIITLLPDFS